MKKLIVALVILGHMALTSWPHTTYANSTLQEQPSNAGIEASRSSAALESLRAAEKLRESAMARGDVELLKSLFSEYYYHVESNGRVRSKTQLLLSVQRGEFKFLSYKVDEMEARLSGLAAVTIGRFTVIHEVGSGQKQYSGRFIRVWEREGNRWRNTMHQATEVKPLAGNSAAVVPTQ